ncbi:DNA gyrase subunit A [Permianibacter aggregans]|uniref:DNA gyrase subunit A n=1 Tax=Permianibacter aggregans TaxID=1510150 RepID=A0A4R6UV52_9GAMM|nr:DNA gyrase subunit A [Permianibacter aggregans]QGX41307.1 DNA gyrase subunit A [Permianibacter aggregans]TDQ51092.1 DNA gyrase subunit A [Permianibacter aggregans]
MTDLAKEIVAISIEDELRTSYLDYAMSVIVGRALPDVRDGLKPVHRRVLYAMNVLGNDYNKAYKKSARVVGDVIGKYHPHGDSAVYDTIVRMAQPFSMRYVLVDGQGNFGSVDGDAAAAMRYTEVRMAKLSHEMLADLDKETVDFVDNYDGSESEPSVLPTRVPNLLVNGSSGIAVGMATNIPPHNLTEVVNGVLALMNDPDISVDDLMEHIPAPDFPTAGIICGRSGIVQGYRTGRGRCVIRARHHYEEEGQKTAIIVTELPYQVNKARLIEKIAELVKEKKLEGISGLRDESDKDGMRVVIELKRGEMPDVVLNNLFSQTQMQTSFGINMVALVDGQPRTLNLKQVLEEFIKHRREVVTRRTVYELRKAREKAHVLEGLAVAIANIDEVIELIKASPTPAEAKERLIAKEWKPGAVMAMLERAGAQASRPEDLDAAFGLIDGVYHLSAAQAQAILELRLHKLTGLEHDKLLDEYKDLLNAIEGFLLILASNERLMEVIREELEAIVKEYGDKRRTEISAIAEDIDIEDLIADEPVVVTLSFEGYVKYQPLSTYEAQRRGGRGKSATDLKDEDYVRKLIVCKTLDYLLCFSNRGRMYWLKAYQLPEAGRGARGRPIVNLLPLQEGERITSLLAVREFDKEKQVFMATQRGVVKRTSLENFSRPRSAGLIAVDLRDDDVLVGVDITSGNDDVMLFSDSGRVVRFKETEVREMGRLARGVRGMRIADDENIISLIVAHEGTDILTITENGYGKRTALEHYPVKGRGIRGVISIKVSERNGKVVSAISVEPTDHFMMISDRGTLVRTRVSEVRVMGRNTQGVRLMRMLENEQIVGLEGIAPEQGDEEDLVKLNVVDDGEE